MEKNFSDYVAEAKKIRVEEGLGLDMANSVATGFVIGTAAAALGRLIAGLYDANKDAIWLKNLKYKFAGGEITKEKVSEIVKEIKNKIPKDEMRLAFNAIMNSPELKDDKNKDFIRRLNASKKDGVFKYEWESAFSKLNKKQVESLKKLLFK